MDYLRSWIINICATVFFITAVEMILPNNTFKKYAKFVLGLILMTVILNPLVKFLNNGAQISTFINKTTTEIQQGYSSSDNDAKQKSINETLSVFKTNLEKLCVKKLEEKYPKEKFQAEAKVTYDSENGDYVIDNINITVDSNMIQKIKRIEINTNTEVPDETLDQSEHGKEIKSVINSELSIDENKIKIIEQNKK